MIDNSGAAFLVGGRILLANRNRIESDAGYGFSQDDRTSIKPPTFSDQKTTNPSQIESNLESINDNQQLLTEETSPRFTGLTKKKVSDVDAFLEQQKRGSEISGLARSPRLQS